MARYWVSWSQPTDDYRPVNYPPNQSILGWWCSGFDENDRAILCAAIDAESYVDARIAIEDEWPEAPVESFRFFDVKPSDWVPKDRFPLSDWMVARFGKDPSQC